MYKFDYINIIIDSELNIIKCNASLYQMVDTSNIVCLADFLSESDCKNILNILNDGSGNLFTKLQMGTCHYVLIEVNKYLPGLFTLNIYDVLAMSRIVSFLEEKNAIYENIFSTLNIDYFTYNSVNDQLIYMNDKGVQTKLTFKSFFAYLKNKFINIPKLNIYKQKLIDCDKYTVFESEYDSRKIKLTLSPFYNALGEKLVLGTIIYDSLSNAIAEKNLSDDLDGLTKLLSKIAIERHITNRVDISKNKTTLLFVDIDDFKIINDTYGHVFGDNILIKVSKIIKNCIGYNGVAGRFGGDEFLVALNTTDQALVREIARGIRTGIQWLSAELDDNSVISCSIGSARYPDDVSDSMDLFKLADKCLYRAKNKGKNRYVLYTYEKHGDMLNQSDDVIVDAVKIDILAQKNFDMIDKCYEENAPIEEIFEQLYSIGKFDRAIMYKGKNMEEILYFHGDDNYSYDGSYLVQDNYYSLFTKQSYLCLSNTTQLMLTHREEIELLFERTVKAVFQYMFKDENGNPLGCISLEVLENPRTFTAEESYFYTLICRIIERIMKRKNLI